VIVRVCYCVGETGGKIYLSAWSKAHSASALKVRKMVGTPGAWSKRVVTILLMSNGCVLGVMCNKVIRVSFPIPIKNQMRSCHGRLLFTWRNLQGNRSGSGFHQICMYTISKGGLIAISLYSF